MKFNAFTYLALGATAAVAAPTPEADASIAYLSGRTVIKNPTDLAVIAKAKLDGVGHQGCVAAIATGLAETQMIMYANINVPNSLKYPHQGVGNNFDSVGIYQQRVSIYKNLACDMNVACSTGQFFTEMKKILGWQTMDVGTLCQKVQRSAYPKRYYAQVPLAKEICAAGGL